MSVSIIGEPSDVGAVPGAPTVVDELGDAPVRVGPGGTRDQEFLEFVGASGRYLLRTAVPLCGDPVRAEELVQATYERVYRSWRVARNGDPQAYARRVLVNLRVDAWRRTRREVVDDPGLAFDAQSEAAFTRVSNAIEHSGVNVYRIEKGGWGPGTSFHLRDSSWMWNWYYSYIPGTPADAPEEERTETRLGVRLQVHVTGNWWFTVEPDD